MATKEGLHELSQFEKKQKAVGARFYSFLLWLARVTPSIGRQVLVAADKRVKKQETIARKLRGRGKQARASRRFLRLLVFVCF